MGKQIAILHYAGPPVVGGVELTILYHARGLADLGYNVRVISGSGSSFDNRVESYIEPLLGSSAPEVLAVKKELDQGIVSNDFHILVDHQEQALRRALAGCGLCIVHNVHTMNKNLPLTVALHRLNFPCIAWCADLAWTNEQYQSELHAGYPWDLLRQPWPETPYVGISDARRLEMAELFQISPDEIAVITPGVDLPGFLQWTPEMRQIENTLHILDADVLLLLPARLTRRKNIELGLHMMAALKMRDQRDYRLIITGPPGPHNPLNSGYLGELLELRSTLGLQECVHFLYELNAPPFIPDDTTMANLYQIADALFFPSLQEGLGIPILEAGLVGLPIFCSDLPPIHQTGQDDVFYFDPVRDAPETIADVIGNYFVTSSGHRLKSRIRHNYRWDVILQNQIVPLLNRFEKQRSGREPQT